MRLANLATKKLLIINEFSPSPYCAEEQAQSFD